MDLYEQLVGIHLTVFEHLAVIPQFLVLFDEKGQPVFAESEGKRSFSACVDFLAINSKKRQAQVVQVRKALAKKEALRLADQLTKKRPDGKTDGEIIDRYIKWFAERDFSVQWRFFVRAHNVEALEARLREERQTSVSVVALEGVFEKLKNVMP